MTTVCLMPKIGQNCPSCTQVCTITHTYEGVLCIWRSGGRLVNWFTIKYIYFNTMYAYIWIYVCVLRSLFVSLKLFRPMTNCYNYKSWLISINMTGSQQSDHLHNWFAISISHAYYILVFFASIPSRCHCLLRNLGKSARMLPAILTGTFVLKVIEMDFLNGYCEVSHTPTPII